MKVTYVTSAYKNPSVKDWVEDQLTPNEGVWTNSKDHSLNGQLKTHQNVAESYARLLQCLADKQILDGQDLSWVVNGYKNSPEVLEQKEVE